MTLSKKINAILACKPGSLVTSDSTVIGKLITCHSSADDQIETSDQQKGDLVNKDLIEDAPFKDVSLIKDQVLNKPNIPVVPKTNKDNTSSPKPLAPYMNTSQLLRDKKANIIQHKDLKDFNLGADIPLAEGITVGMLVDFASQSEKFAEETLEGLSVKIQDSWNDRETLFAALNGIKDAVRSYQNVNQYLSILDKVASHRLNYVRQQNLDKKGRNKSQEDKATPNILHDAEGRAYRVEGGIVIPISEKNIES